MSLNETEKLLGEAVSRFGAEAKKKLANPAVAGAPEDQLRAPLERLIQDLMPLLGLAAHDAVLVGESSLSDLKTRPDYAVTRKNALIGFIEVKAPGKGVAPSRFADPHDKDQWEKLKALPNLIYTDGNGFSLWRNGSRYEDFEVHLNGDVRTAGAALSAPAKLLALFTHFFRWDPIPPKSPPQLADVSARLCRLLRDEVSEQLARGAQGLTSLATDWRKVLFPNATDEEFADGYAQAVTFGLLMAKARRISLANGPEAAAKALRKSNSLIGTALGVLTDEAAAETVKTSLKTLTRVLDKVEWGRISKGDPEAWLYFYEKFLARYDNDLRKKTGSYYTPPEIVNEMVRLTDDALRTRFGQHQGFASPDVTVADPAVGTGTFLLGILKRIAATVSADGPGMAPGAVQEALKRLVAFEIQFGPFAVAQLRLLAEIAELTAKGPEEEIDANLRLYVADTLADPDEETAWIPTQLGPIAESRRKANAIKRKEPITVVIGNPPYKVGAKGLGGWVEDRGALPAPLASWMPPAEWGVGEHAKHLYNLYVYFWRWAVWKVFGGDPYRSGTDKSEAKWTNRRGIVCFITAAGFLNGPGFQKMRADLRRDADEIWVIDCSPEGHQPPVNTRVFEGVQQPVCIVIALRKNEAKPNEPARVRFRQLPPGHRESVKFKAIAQIELDDAGWQEASRDWRDSFFPAAAQAWKSYPAIQSLFDYDGSGVMPGRVWVIAPDKDSLAARWNRLIHEKQAATKASLFHPHLRNGQPGDKHIDKVVGEGLAGQPHRSLAVEKDKGEVVPPIRYGFRSFDRQWIIPDARLLNQPNPNLWRMHCSQQVYLTAWHRYAPENGPSVTFTGLMPDMDHYKGNFGGRVMPLWADATASQPNVRQSLLNELSLLYGREVTAEDVFAYIAAVAAHPGYTSRFAADLAQPGLRIPITEEAKLFDEAAEIGREVVWLHTFGERFSDASKRRPPAPPRIADGPTIPKNGAIPLTADKFPDEIRYDPGERRLHVGEGFIDNVAPEVWSYEISGMHVLKQWFSYRRHDRSRPLIGGRREPSPLGDIQPDHWLPEYTSELVNVLHVLARLRALEPTQADLLQRIVEGPTRSVEALGDALRKQI